MLNIRWERWATIHMHFLIIFVHPAVSRQKIACLDSPYILVYVCRILDVQGRSSVHTTNFPVWAKGNYGWNFVNTVKHVFKGWNFSLNEKFLVFHVKFGDVKLSKLTSHTTENTTGTKGDFFQTKAWHKILSFYYLKNSYSKRNLLQ